MAGGVGRAGVIDRVAERAVLRAQYVKGERERLLARAFMIRVIVLMTLMPDAGNRDAVIALAGAWPWSRGPGPGLRRRSGRSGTGGTRSAGAAGGTAGHRAGGFLPGARGAGLARGRRRPGQAAAGVVAGRDADPGPGHPGEPRGVRPVGTGDDSSPFPQPRALPLTEASTRGLLGMPDGPAGTDKAAAEQKLLDPALRDHPHLFTADRIWLMDGNYPGAERIARLAAAPDVLIRLKSDIPLKRTSPILADGSYLAELSGDGVTMAVRVIEYYAEVEGQEVPEMFCLVTDLTDVVEYPALELAGLFKWRWDGSDALREAKASLDGAGPEGSMLTSGTPLLVRQELAACAAGTEMTRDISHTRARRAIITEIRAGATCYEALTREIAIPRHRRREPAPRPQARFAQHLRPPTAKDIRTRIVRAVITMATPA